MTQSPCLPELPPLEQPLSLIHPTSLQRMILDYATAHGLACYEAGSAAAARAVPGWIGVEDRLPDERASAYLVAVIAKKTYSEGSNYPGMGVRSVVQDWVVRNYASSYTHWMALPEITPAAPTQGAEGAAPQAVDDERRCQELRERGWQVLKCPACGCDGAVGYPRAAPQAVDALREALDQERAKFQQETRRTSALSVLLRKWVDRHEAEHGPGPWARGCELCALVGESQSLLSAPINAALAQHQPQQGEGRGSHE